MAHADRDSSMGALKVLQGLRLERQTERAGQALLERAAFYEAQVERAREEARRERIVELRGREQARCEVEYVPRTTLERIDSMREALVEMRERAEAEREATQRRIEELGGRKSGLGGGALVIASAVTTALLTVMAVGVGVPASDLAALPDATVMEIDQAVPSSLWPEERYEWPIAAITDTARTQLFQNL